MKIKNILLTIFLFFIISMPVFASEVNNIFIPDITKDQAKKAIIGRALTTNWQVKNDSEYTLDIYRIKLLQKYTIIHSNKMIIYNRGNLLWREQ